MKKILITSTDLMMIQFLVPHIKNLSSRGYKVEIACSEVGGRLNEIEEILIPYVEKIHKVRLYRSPIQLKNILGYKDMRRIIKAGDYDIIWTNEPVMGVVTRIAARKQRKKGLKVLYMVHGLHFYKGAPKKNWLVFYPIEKIMLNFTDVICTVNREDYHAAFRMGANDVRYIHGIGINTDRLVSNNNPKSIRQQLELDQETFIVLSVGELNKNKNQIVIIEALHLLNDSNIHYLLCGKGDQLKYLKQETERFGLEKQVHFLGYRTDVKDILRQSNLFVMPSRREGLPVSSLEAMYCGLPLVTSRIRGLVDIMVNGETGYLCDPDNPNQFAEAIEWLKKHPEKRSYITKKNKNVVQPYCIDKVKEEVVQLIDSL